MAHSLIMATPVQLFFVLFVLPSVAAAKLPAGPGWEWVSSIEEMGGKEFGEVVEPLVKMNRNAKVYPDVIPIEGWVVSAKVEPLWQEGGGQLAIVYEEVVEEVPRAVIAFRGSEVHEGNAIDVCAFEVLRNNEEEMNATLVTWCYATYNASRFDYYAQGVTYTMLVLESYAASSVLMSGVSMGGMLADLTAAGVATHYSVDLPVLAFLNQGRRNTMLRLGLSLQAHHTPIIGAANQWDPEVIFDWDYRIGTMCLFPTQEPDVCSACLNAHSLQSHHLIIAPTLPPLYPQSDACLKCYNLTHDSLLLLRFMLNGSNPTCYLMEEDPTLQPQLQLPILALPSE